MDEVSTMSSVKKRKEPLHHEVAIAAIKSLGGTRKTCDKFRKELNLDIAVWSVNKWRERGIPHRFAHIVSGWTGYAAEDLIKTYKTDLRVPVVYSPTQPHESKQ
jgi:hypothetical protein